jgi:hypothetical protein
MGPIMDIFNPLTISTYSIRRTESNACSFGWWLMAGAGLC